MRKRIGLRGFLMAVTVAYCGLIQLDRMHGAAEAATKPNILFIILDDVGIDQMKSFGYGGLIPAKLPNMAKIARRGVKFTNVWAMPECSPTRAALFTGRYPIRTGVDSAIVGNHLPQEYMSQYEATLPRVLAKAGYVSSMVGKYHLGNEHDPAGDCAPSTRGWDHFAGNMTPGPPSIDKTAGGGDPSGSQVCGYFQTTASGACYKQNKDSSVTCTQITPANADANTSPSRTCLQKGGLFRPNTACGASVPTSDDFAQTNAYYVWSRITNAGPRQPEWVAKSDDACAPTTNRQYMTEKQSFDGAKWWNKQTGPRMLTLSYNAIHTPLQKSPTDVVPDPRDFRATCNSLRPQRRLINNMLESADVEIGRMLASIGLGTLGPDGRTLATLNLGNTVVIIVGDNGSYGTTVRVADGFSLARSKGTVYQTGVWVPLIVAGSIVASPGRNVDEMINVADLFQLFGDLAGLDVNTIVPPTHTLDSKPLMPYLTSPTASPVRTTNFTQLAAGTFSSAPADRSWPCLLANICNETLLFDQALCEDNGGVWYGPGGAQQLSSCCAVVAANPGSSISAVAQWAVRNKFYKLVELLQTNCAVPLSSNPTNKPFPWAEYDTKSTREFYDIRKTASNPVGMDNADDNLLQNCAEGQDPTDCLAKPAQRQAYKELSKELRKIRKSAKPQSTCRNLGDGNQDLRVNQADIDAWKIYRGKGPSQYDINLDGQTNRADLAIIQANLGTDCSDLCTRADLDRNRRVNSKDMKLLVQQTGTCDPVLCSGDLNGDGKVDSQDARLMRRAQAACSR